MLRAEILAEADRLSYDESGCRLWHRRLSNLGYGIAHLNGHGAIGVHVLVLERKLGRKLLPGMKSLHTCDAPNCCAEEHVYEGTQADNVRDMMERGRHNATKGERNHHAKITEADVRAIRDLYDNTNLSQRQIGSRFNLTRAHVAAIGKRHSWKHVV